MLPLHLWGKLRFRVLKLINFLTETSLGNLVGITLDDEVLSLVDEIITSMAASSKALMNRLTHLGFIPKGQIPTLIFAAFLFVHHYNEARKDSTIIESLEISKAMTFGNPILQRFFAQMSAQTVNGAIVK